MLWSSQPSLLLVVILAKSSPGWEKQENRQPLEEGVGRYKPPGPRPSDRCELSQERRAS
jgi:hypothetical protein